MKLAHCGIMNLPESRESESSGLQINLNTIPGEAYSPTKHMKKNKPIKKNKETASITSTSSSGLLGDFEDFFEGKYFKQLNIEVELDKYIHEMK